MLPFQVKEDIMVVPFVSCISGLPLLYAGGIGGLISFSDALAKYFSEKERQKALSEESEQLDKTQDTFMDSASTTASDESDQDSLDEPLSPLSVSDTDPFASVEISVAETCATTKMMTSEATTKQVLITWE